MGDSAKGTEAEKSVCERARRYGKAGYQQFIVARSKLVQELLRTHSTDQVAAVLKTNHATVVQWKRLTNKAANLLAPAPRRKPAQRLTRSQLRGIAKYGLDGLARFRAERASLITELQRSGWTMRQIGAVLGVSHTLARRWGREGKAPPTRQGPALIRYVKRNLGRNEWKVVEMLASKSPAKAESVGAQLGIGGERLREILVRLENIGVVVGTKSLVLEPTLLAALKDASRKRPPPRQRQSDNRDEACTDENQVPAILAATPGYVSFTREFLDLKVRTDETRRKYGEAVRRFCQWCDLQGIGTLSELTTTSIEDYRRELALSLASTNSTRVHMSGVRSWLDHLTQVGSLAMNPARVKARSKAPMTQSKEVASWRRAKNWLSSPDRARCRA